MPPALDGVDARWDRRRIWNQRLGDAPSFDTEAFARQVRSASYLDARTGELIDVFVRRGRPTTVVVCADHGECFGEDGLSGHGFYHPSVMTVPLLVFRLNAPPHPASPATPQRSAS